ncbi:MAG: hypothetical protein ACI4II_05610 [Acutalibacteraceae bacterium]
MNKKQKSSVNLFFSAFLVVAYVVCAYFFDKLTTARVDSVRTQTLFQLAIYAVFGLVLFYATRVGDGKQIVRFSLSALILMVIPSLYVICCLFFPSALPFATTLTASQNVIILSAVVLGYGLPYTFTSGFELEVEPEEAEGAEKKSEEVKSEEVKTEEVKTEETEEQPESDKSEEEAPVALESEPVVEDVAVASESAETAEEADDEIDSLEF